MIFRSIKWRLQAWHALMLLLVLAGFGFTAHQLDRVNRLQRIDRELQQRVTAITAALARGGGRPGLGPPPEFEGFPPGPDGSRRPPDDPGLGPPGGGPPGLGSPDGRGPFRGLALPDR